MDTLKLPLEKMKRYLRGLKKEEAVFRYGRPEPPRGAALVWDEIFGKSPTVLTKYTPEELAAMDREAVARIVEEYFYHVYYRYCRDRGLVEAPPYDTAALAQLGLPPDADRAAVKKRFRELAMRHHPDRGGDAEEFIKMMDTYRQAISKGL